MRKKGEEEGGVRRRGYAKPSRCWSPSVLTVLLGGRAYQHTSTREMHTSRVYMYAGSGDGKVHVETFR